jgi:hypothetical protein
MRNHLVAMGATNATPHARAKDRRDWRSTFLRALAEQGTVSAACAAAAIDRSTAYRARQADEDFALAWADIESEVTEQLEEKAVEIALAGDGHLLRFLLQHRLPDKYGKTVKLEHAGSIGRDLRSMSDAELADLEAELDARRRGER